MVVNINVDINGNKKPNVVGKDVFYMRLFDLNSGWYKDTNWDRIEIMDGGIDRGTAKNSSSFGCKKDSTGLFCGRLIQLDGWEIKDDYPW